MKKKITLAAIVTMATAMVATPVYASGRFYDIEEPTGSYYITPDCNPIAFNGQTPNSLYIISVAETDYETYSVTMIDQVYGDVILDEVTIYYDSDLDYYTNAWRDIDGPTVSINKDILDEDWILSVDGGDVCLHPLSDPDVYMIYGNYDAIDYCEAWPYGIYTYEDNYGDIQAVALFPFFNTGWYTCIDPNVNMYLCKREELYVDYTGCTNAGLYFGKYEIEASPYLTYMWEDGVGSYELEYDQGAILAELGLSDMHREFEDGSSLDMIFIDYGHNSGCYEYTLSTYFGTFTGNCVLDCIGEFMYGKDFTYNLNTGELFYLNIY